jgi:hypothetical protein
VFSRDLFERKLKGRQLEEGGKLKEVHVGLKFDNKRQ